MFCILAYLREDGFYEKGADEGPPPATAGMRHQEASAAHGMGLSVFSSRLRGISEPDLPNPALKGLVEKPSFLCWVQDYSLRYLMIIGIIQKLVYDVENDFKHHSKSIFEDH